MGIISPINTETATIVVAVPVEGLNTETGIEIGDTLKEIGRVAKRSRLCRWYSQLRGHS